MLFVALVDIHHFPLEPAPSLKILILVNTYMIYPITLPRNLRFDSFASSSAISICQQAWSIYVLHVTRLLPFHSASITAADPCDFPRDFSVVFRLLSQPLSQLSPEKPVLFSQRLKLLTDLQLEAFYGSLLTTK